MAQLIDIADVISAIEALEDRNNCGTYDFIEAKSIAYKQVREAVNAIEVKEVDLEKESELIANGIMIGVQANKYHTCVYNTNRCDFNHSHLMLAARKGIEFGLKAQKGE